MDATERRMMAFAPAAQNPWRTQSAAAQLPVKTATQTAQSAQSASPTPGTPEYGAAQLRAANGAGAGAASASTNAANMHDQWVNGQLRASSSAGAAADRAGSYWATQTGPGGPMSAAVQTENAKAAAAKEAERVRQEADAKRQADATASGLDLMKPGANEAFVSAHGGDLLSSSPANDFWGQYGTQIMQPGQRQTYADKTLANPYEAPPADLNAYYDRAQQNVITKLGAQQSARGAYGSSVGVGQVGSALADLEAQRVKDTADYQLKRSADARDWTNTYSDVAAGADSDQLNRWTAAGSAAATADTSAVNRWKATESATVDAQGSQRQRGQDLFNNQMTIGNALSGTVGESFSAGSQQDQALLDAIIKLGLGKDAASVASEMRRAQQDQAYASQILDAVKAMDTKSEAPKSGNA